MAKDSSFDIVSKVDLQNLDNAINNSIKEIKTRYDLKNTSSNIEFDKSSEQITLVAGSDLQLDQITQILYQKMAKLSIDLKSIKSSGREASGGDKIKEIFKPIDRKSVV